MAHKFIVRQDVEKRNTIILNGNTVSVSVSVAIFKEGDTFIAYCPSLDLSGYDTTEDKARADFEYVLKEWLIDYGWTDYHFRIDCHRSGCVPRMDLYEIG